jgi:hypothetical protein
MLSVPLRDFSRVVRGEISLGTRLCRRQPEHGVGLGINPTRHQRSGRVSPNPGLLADGPATGGSHVQNSPLNRPGANFVYRTV